MFSDLRIFLTGKEFVISFWSSLLSGIIIAFVLGVLVTQFTDLIKSPKLSMVVKQNGTYSNYVSLSQDGSGDYEATFSLAIKNSGNLTLEANGGYWNIYFPNASNIQAIQGSQGFLAANENGHLRDIISIPVYANYLIDFGPSYQIHIKKTDLNNASIKYFFATEYGYFPKSVKLDQNTGLVLYKDMGSISFQLASTT